MNYFGKYLIVISRFSSFIFFWLSLQIVNFRFIPVAHQFNFCLAVSLVWATILSVIRASEASHVKEIESIDTISITNYSVEATQQWPWSDGPWRKNGKNPLRKFSRLSSVVPLLLSRCWLSEDEASHAPIHGVSLWSRLGGVRFWGSSLRSRRLEVVGANAPVLSCAHYFQAPATQAIEEENFIVNVSDWSFLKTKI